MAIVTRPGSADDVPALADVYNHYVRTSPATFDIDPLTDEQAAAKFGEHKAEGPYRIFVADDEGRVLGYASSGRFRPKAAYATTVDVSVYIAPEGCGRGIGTQLYTALFDAIAGEDLHRAIAGITQPNDTSVALHTRFGFRELGVFREIGRKFERWWDVAWYEKALS